MSCHHQELELYSDALMNKPAVLALNKMDIEGADELLEDILEKVNNLEGEFLSLISSPWACVACTSQMFIYSFKVFRTYFFRVFCLCPIFCSLCLPFSDTSLHPQSVHHSTSVSTPNNNNNGRNGSCLTWLATS